MADDQYVSARDRLHAAFASRAGLPPATWLGRVWARAVLLTPGGDDEAVVEVLTREWAAYCAAHPDAPDVTFRPPPDQPAEPVVPAPPPYADLLPLRHGRYGLDLPTHEERVREEQERLARRDAAHFGF
jgi:hypothetical protein